MMKKLAALICLHIHVIVLSAQEKTDNFLVKLLQTQPENFKEILNNPSKYRVQILYTQIDRDKNNVPHFKSYHYRVNKDEYFYPASTVKFPACLLAIEKYNQLNIAGLTPNSIMLNDSVEKWQYKRLRDETNILRGGKPTLAHYIKKILLVSDNDAFNRLYEFMGQEDFNETLHKKGYKDVRIVHRLSIPLSREQNRRSNPVVFLNDKGDTLYKQPVLVNTKIYEPRGSIKLGKGFMTSGSNYYVGDSLVSTPFDFTYKNYYALANQQAVLKAALFPENIPVAQRFNIKKEDYTLLYKYMSMSPLESKCPVYPDRDSAGAWDSYCKFLMFGDSKEPMPKHIRIFNKVGDAYGFLLDNAYIVDFEKGVEFMLTAVIYCNSDEIFNDDKYDYEKVGFPFMANLGKLIYNYELKRPRKVKPDLSKFKIDYSKAD